MTRASLRMAWPAVAAMAAFGLPAGAWGAKPLPSVHRLESHSKLVALPFISPPPRLNRTMKWAHSSTARQLAMSFTSTQDHAVVGLERPQDARAVATAYGVTVVALDAGLHMMEVKAPPTTLNRLAHAASWDDRLRFVDPLVDRHYLRLRNDPALLQIDTVTGRPFEWNFGATRADLAYNLSKGNPDILVGVVDTGVSNVPDLKDKIAESWFFNDQSTSSDDTDGHGTAVSSIIAATVDDGVGIAGFGGAARIDMYRDRALNGFSDAVAIHRLVDRGVRIINLSFGGGGISQSEFDALNYASDAGVLLIAASGNGGTGQVIWPARQLQSAGGVVGPGLAVGASIETGAKADFSNYGSNLSLLAPGSFADNDCSEGIYAPISPVANFFDTNVCSRAYTDPVTSAHYRYLRGTSFSTPTVAGAAALIWAARPDLKNYEVASLLERGATHAATTGWDSNSGWGILDIAKSMELATGQSAADRIDLTLTDGESARAGRHFTRTATLNWADGAAVDTATIICSASIGGKPLTLLVQSFAAGQATCTWGTPAAAGGRSLSGTIAATEPQSNLSATAPFTTLLVDITHPKVHALASPGRWGARVPLHYTASDETGAVSVKVRVYRGGTIAATGSAPFHWTAPTSPTSAAFRFCVTAKDKAGNASSSCAPIRLS
jgi:subtilisin family serine protease